MLADINLHDPSFQWLLIALGVATLYYAVIRPAMKKKKDPLERSPIAGTLNKERLVERQMQNLLVELSEMTRQISAQLDTRSQKLLMLIQDADERIAELKKLQLTSIISMPEPAPAPVALIETHTGGVASATLLDALEADSVAEATLPASMRLPDPDPVDEEHQRIYNLADRGQNPGDIAKELNRPHGEIELILALRPRAVSF